MPELPLLAVLPGTGGLTRLTDKRKVRRDRADVFCTAEEGVRGQRAVEWRLVDEIVPPSAWEATVARARRRARRALRPAGGRAGIVLTPLEREFSDDAIDYPHVRVALDRAARRATITLRGPAGAAGRPAPASMRQGAAFWPLALARELDDAHPASAPERAGARPARVPHRGRSRRRCWPPTRCWKRMRTTGWCAKSACC